MHYFSGVAQGNGVKRYKRMCLRSRVHACVYTKFTENTRKYPNNVESRNECGPYLIESF